jgi:hypothetical protein
MIKKLTGRMNGLTAARGLTKNERKELGRLKEMEAILRGRLDSSGAKETLKERTKKIIQMDKGMGV